jgi:hypothetical protein
MSEKKLNTIIRLGMWIAVFAGSTFGLVLTIAGYLADLGPGGGMEGPLWEIFLVGALSFIVAASLGVFLFNSWQGKSCIKCNLHLK